MTDAEFNRKCAEFCGWAYHPERTHANPKWRAPDGYYLAPPNYANDPYPWFDEVHAAIERAESGLWRRWVMALIDVVCVTEHLRELAAQTGGNARALEFCLISATAAQRRAALEKVLVG